MVSWVLVILILAGIVVYFKTTGARFGKAWTFFIAGVIIFVVATLGYVVTRPDVDITSVEGFSNAIRLYFVFLSNLFDTANSITANVVNTDWTNNLSAGAD